MSTSMSMGMTQKLNLNLNKFENDGRGMAQYFENLKKLNILDK